MTRHRLLVGGLALALVAALVAVVVLWRDRDQVNDRAESSAELVDASVAAEKVAREVVTRLTTYSFRTVEEDFSWVDQAGTERFQKSFDSAGAVELVKTFRAVAVGEVVDSAANAADPDHVKVLLFVDQRIRSAGKRGSRGEQTRVTAQLVQQDGRWLVDELNVANLLSAPATRKRPH